MSTSVSPYNHPLNYINSLFYGACPEAFTASGLANFFVTAKPVQLALFRHLCTRFPSTSLKIQEICAGTHLDRWRYISTLTPPAHWDITLSDFSPSSLPLNPTLLNNSHFSFHTKLHNLFASETPLPPSSRYDVILTTYGFDSVWFPEDRFYLKTPWGWYKRHFTFPSPLPPSLPSPNTLPSALKHSYSLDLLRQFTVSGHFVPIDIHQEPFGPLISQYYCLYPVLTTNFPGGLISKIQQFFNDRLKPTGIFLSGDVAYSGAGLPSQYPYKYSGQIARYQTHNYSLAAFVLRKLGYQVHLYTLPDFLELYHQSLPFDLSTQCILEVSQQIA